MSWVLLKPARGRASSGATQSVAPATSVPQISATDPSKPGANIMEARSPGTVSCSARYHAAMAVSERCSTMTSFGVPDEPDVLMT